ncbi:MAG: hypothetical protein QF619_06130 [Candidatus Binatia bacterium]|jgi:3-polyprenyl-4-hydroxybenzoate decarboxylase|nr:hypothetical protein [Candidatus Binatia bacterium]
MAKDLRSFIKEVSVTMPDQIHMITEEVDAKFGITAVAGRLAKEGKFPALALPSACKPPGGNG